MCNRADGMTVLLPEEKWDAALASLRDLDQTQHLLSKGIRSVDMRVDGRISVAVAEIAKPEPVAPRRARRSSMWRRELGHDRGASAR